MKILALLFVTLTACTTTSSEPTIDSTDEISKVLITYNGFATHGPNAKFDSYLPITGSILLEKHSDKNIFFFPNIIGSPITTGKEIGPKTIKDTSNEAAFTFWYGVDSNGLKCEITMAVTYLPYEDSGIRIFVAHPQGHTIAYSIVDSKELPVAE